MKVIFVMVSMAGGGAERVISILANRFVQRGIDVTILMTAGNEVAYELDERIQLLCAGTVSGGSMRKRIERVRNIRRVFKENPDSVIISFGPGTSFFAVLADLFLDRVFLAQNGFGNRMRGVRFEALGEREQPCFVVIAKALNLAHGQLSLAKRARFVENERLDIVQRLQESRALDEDSAR